MRVTRYGLQGAVFLVLMYGAFFATPYSNLFFLLLAFLTLQWVLAAWSGRRNVRGVALVLEELPCVPAGAPVAVEAGLTAPAHSRSRFQLVVRLRLAGGGTLVGHVDVLDGRAAVTLASPPFPRGVHAVEAAELESCHPFGLLRARVPLTAPSELVVHPAPARLLEGRSAADALDELLGTQLAGAGDLQPAGLRDHRDGDDVRAIHWRASARRGRLVALEWEGGSGQGLELLLDRRAPADALEEALSTVVAVQQHARTNKETLTLHTQELSATFGPGHRDWAELLRFLAETTALRADGPAPPVVSPAVARLPRALAPA